LALPLDAREDIIQFHTFNLQFSANLNNKVTDEMLRKGIYVRLPYIQPVKSIHFAQHQPFLGGFFEAERPITVIEISTLYANIETNLVGSALIMGFSQVAKS